MRNQVLPDGKKVYEYNIGPRFHDISVVLNGADKTAKLIEIVASEDTGLDKAASFSEAIGDMTYEAAPAQPLKLASTHINKISDIQKDIIDRLYVLAILNKMTEADVPEVAELVDTAKEAGIPLALELEKTAGPIKDLRNLAIGSTGIALATNYLQGKRLRGEPTTQVQNFIADNPGVLPLAFILAGYPAYKAAKKRMSVLKAAALSIDGIQKDYTQLFTKEAASYNLDVTNSIDIFSNALVNETAKQACDIDDTQLKMIKSALVFYGTGREDLVNKAKEIYHISDAQIGDFLKISYDAIVADIEKEAGIGRSVIEAQLLNPTTNKGVPVGLSAPVIVGSLLDGWIYHKFFSSDKADDMKKINSDIKTN
jgi:hypothetical protein